MTDGNDGAKSQQDEDKNHQNSSVTSSKVQGYTIADSLLETANVCEIVPPNNTHGSQQPLQQEKKQRRCVCGSTTHLRRSSKDCPLNKKKNDEIRNRPVSSNDNLLMMKSLIPNTTGPCCLREKCKFPTLELRPQHRCPKCLQIVHPLCGIFNSNTDKYHCPDCTDVGEPQQNLTCSFIDDANDSLQQAENLFANITTDATEKNKTNNTDGELDQFFEIANDTDLVELDKNILNNASELCIEDNGKKSEKNFYEPTNHEIPCAHTFEPVIDVNDPSYKQRDTMFKLKQNNHSAKEIEPTAAALVEHFFDDNMIQNIVNSSNAYMYERKRREPKLSCFRSRATSRAFTSSCIYHFLALIYYFGMVRLPSKRDYWERGIYWMPSHPICEINGLNRERFEFIWRHFHCNHATDDDFVQENEKNEDENNEDELVTFSLERVQHDQEVNAAEEYIDNTKETSTEEAIKKSGMIRFFQL